MTEHHRRLLIDKLTANNQRRIAREFLAALTPELRMVLGCSRVVVQPESVCIAQYQLFTEFGIGADQRIRPHDFTFLACREPREVLAALGDFGDRADDTVGYFRPTGYWQPSDGRRDSGDERPFFEVGFGWARRRWAELCEVAQHHCGLTTRTGEAGIVTRVVCGYWDRHADERVYELAFWRAG